MKRVMIRTAAAWALVLSACASPDRTGEAYRPLAVGDTVPAYGAATFAGDTVRVASGGELTLVNIWATWCSSCREEMADLEAIHRDYGSRGLEVIAVSVDAGNGERVRRFVEGENLTFAVAHDPAGRIQQLYGVAAVPETYLVSKDGRLLWQLRGGLHGSADKARAAIDEALRADGRASVALR
jgi:cytochrome c biogenesis protein CcmG, thiol:disulfide interchange protein DsbE